MSSRVKEEILKLLKEDEEFRYAVAGLLGLEEILRRIDDSVEAIRDLQKQVAEHTRAIRDLQEQVVEHGGILRRLVASVQAIGMRYGVFTEDAFREGIKYLISDVLGEYKVERVIIYDEEGIVYGHPSTVEIDVAIRDAKYILIEYKSMADMSDVAELYRIGVLFEKKERVKPRLLLVASTIKRRAKQLADRLGIDVRGTVLER